eukprot:1160276-Pelagomonas_calceolata.AAC.1
MAEAKERSRAGGKKAAGTGIKFEAEATGWLQQHSIPITVCASFRGLAAAAQHLHYPVDPVQNNAFLAELVCTSFLGCLGEEAYNRAWTGLMNMAVAVYQGCHRHRHMFGWDYPGTYMQLTDAISPQKCLDPGMGYACHAPF